MTGVLVAFPLGLLTATAAAALLWRRWTEAHHWRRIRLEATRVDILCAECDHLRRHNRRLTDEHVELREGVGDLLDTVAHQRHVIDTLTEPPASAVPDYGVWRTARYYEELRVRARAS